MNLIYEIIDTLKGWHATVNKNGYYNWRKAVRTPAKTQSNPQTSKKTNTQTFKVYFSGNWQQFVRLHRSFAAIFTPRGGNKGEQLVFCHFIAKVH